MVGNKINLSGKWVKSRQIRMKGEIICVRECLEEQRGKKKRKSRSIISLKNFLHFSG